MVTRLYTPLIPLPGGGNLALPEEERAAEATQDALSRQRSHRTPQQQAWLERQEDSRSATTTLQANASLAVVPSAPLAVVPPHPGQSALPIVTSQPERPTAWQSSAVPITSATQLQTVAEHSQSQAISSRAILQDFVQTTDLLNATPAVRDQVFRYLSVAELEARSPQPNTELMGSLLKRAAYHLDDHVTQALQAESTVVREWVDALLQQPIDWPLASSQVPLVPGNAPRNSEQAHDAAAELAAHPAQWTPERRQAVATALQQYQLARLEGQPTQALNHLQAGLAQLEGVNRPDLAGKFYRLTGRLHAEQQEWPPANTAYEQARLAFGQAQMPQRVSAVWLEQAQGYQRVRQHAVAQALLQQGLQDPAVAQAGAASQAQLWHELGLVQLQQGQLPESRQSFQQTLVLSPAAALQMDAYHNLAQAYRREGYGGQAEQAYRQALALARQQQQTGAYRNSLAQLVGLYVDSGQTHKASQLLPLLNGLSKRA